MANKDYLTTVHKEKPKEYYVNMGKQSGEARRKKKDMRDTIQEILKMSVYLIGEEAARAVPYLSKRTTVQEAILLGQAVKAVIDKDTKAAEFIRDTSGQKPTDKHEVEGHITYEEALKKVIGNEM